MNRLNIDSNRHHIVLFSLTILPVQSMQNTKSRDLGAEDSDTDAVTSSVAIVTVCCNNLSCRDLGILATS